MPYWLMKSEPDEFSIQDLKKLGHGRWDGRLARKPISARS